MKKLTLLSVVLLLGSVSCQNSANSPGEQGNSQSTLNCKAGTDFSTLKVQGHTAAQPGETVRYSLTDATGCVAGFKGVTWKTVAQSEKPHKGAQYASTFNKPGEYVVTATLQSSESPTPIEVSMMTVVNSGFFINGPQYGMAELLHKFSLVVPSGQVVTSATWNMGDGSAPINGMGPIEHTFFQPGKFTVTVNLTLQNGEQTSVSHAVEVLPPTDGMECVRDLAVSGPSTVGVGKPAHFVAFIPTCLLWRVAQVRWNFGDGSLLLVGTDMMHTYTAPGTYQVVVDLFQGEGRIPFLTLRREITVTDDEEPPPPPNPNACDDEGARRDILGDNYMENMACGINGTKKNTYRDRVTEECKFEGESRLWVPISTTKELVSEGMCEGQACELPAEALTGVDGATANLLLINGKWYMPHGMTKTFYPTQTPNGACSEVGQVRLCNNGMLEGSQSHVYLLCHDGCPGVGPHGTVLEGIVTGEESVAKMCPFGEQGVFDLFNVLSDKKCDMGQTTTFNVRRGDIKQAGVCPSYQWVPTDEWTACSADCGGEQTRGYVCKSMMGDLSEVVPNERCTTPMPIEKRLCDGNPDAVKRTETTVTVEDASSSEKCPANQIGTVSKKRDVTKTDMYACIDHSVKLASSNVTYGDWIIEKNCRDFVPYRCSNDSLSVSEARDRYLWMVRCQDQQPVLKEFLQTFDDAKGNGKAKKLKVNGREVYATFMNRYYKPERPWIAPTRAEHSCHVPQTAYVAGVCVPSCAMPEEQIMALDTDKKLKYVSFIDAWTKGLSHVATLTQPSLKNNQVARTKVDTWVTEIEDADHEIVVFTMKSGRELKLTPNHPVVTKDGTLKLVEDFTVGEPLVLLGGELDPIVSIKRIAYHGKVYNVFVQSNAWHQNIVVTNGYLNGTAFFQNEGADLVNRQILRRNLIRGALE